MVQRNSQQPRTKATSFEIGNTKVIIRDDYCREKTAEEIDAVLRRIADMAQRHFVTTASSL
jgi:hemerythrin